MDEKDLKIAALKGRIGEIVSEYEERIADLRVVITQQAAEAERVDAAAKEAEGNESEGEEI